LNVYLLRKSDENKVRRREQLAEDSGRRGALGKVEAD
jgi:hypothetical protein